MDIKYFIYRNVKKNIKNYFLYVFALIFSVSLYFSFVTIQYDPSMDEMKESVNSATAIKVGSILLVFIVTVFLLYANTLFIKRRGKEIGLFQLLGMSKIKILGILSAENLILYIGSLIIGISLGFSMSKLIIMILFKMTGIKVIATLTFSTEALIQTGIVFATIFLFILLMNFLFINRQTILSLFQSTTTSEHQEKKQSFFEIFIGLLGIGFIVLGYFISAELFSGNYPGYKLFVAMLAIIACIILGTYFFYKGSISFILHVIRKKKNGYVTLNNVLSLWSLMFRIKSNAFLLTIITLVSALSITLLSLTYISYYSAEKSAEQIAPYDFSLFEMNDVNNFTTVLDKSQIEYTITEIDVLLSYADITDALVPGSYEHLDIGENPVSFSSVISAESISHLEVADDEVLFTKPAKMLENMLVFKNSGTIKFFSGNDTTRLKFIGLENKNILPLQLTEGFPVAIVNNDVFKQLEKEADPSVQNYLTNFTGIDINSSSQLQEANTIFRDLKLYKLEGGWEGSESRLEVNQIQKQSVGLTMFIVGFLGLTFLITSGCVLYFKQMDDSETEKPTFTILRKLGFTEEDLLRGIRMKQVINFGIPLTLGLSHSFFGIKSGWFIFGSEMWTPMITVMSLYTVLYSIFGILSVFYYKKVIKKSL
ncbi:ABC transporter permease [Pseudogracilibacillus sp. SE30717A]|uniref:ABC transporter permease n=1 Tax=Pseudogracilibacillus sp. SE30717A TaxID=3098293 RepID=UPI00300E0778